MVYEQILVEFSLVAPIPQERIKILIIDDDSDHLECLGIAFRRQGYEALTAQTAKSGMALVHRHEPQLVIMDIHLPDGDGLQLCQRLADEESTCEIPVIILSGSDRPDIVRSARAAGCQYFLRKPFDPNALLRLVEDSLGDRNP